MDVHYAPSGERDARSAQQWWLEHHGNAPSPLQAELAEANVALATHPYLGKREPAGNRFRLLLRCGFYVVYRVRPRLGRIEIIGVRHRSRLYG